MKLALFSDRDREDKMSARGRELFLRSSPRKRGPRGPSARTEYLALSPRLRGDERRIDDAVQQKRRTLRQEALGIERLHVGRRVQQLEIDERLRQPLERRRAEPAVGGDERQHVVENPANDVLVV